MVEMVDVLSNVVFLVFWVAVFHFGAYVSYQEYREHRLHGVKDYETVIFGGIYGCGAVLVDAYALYELVNLGL